MGSVRPRADSKLLFFDFVYKGIRCREQTTLPDTKANRRKMEKVMDKIEAEKVLGTFVYENYFPESKNLVKFEALVKGSDKVAPTLTVFGPKWFDENTVRWKKSYEDAVQRILDLYLYPTFGDFRLSEIDKGMVLDFRSKLGKVKKRGKVGLSNDRINHIITVLSMILEDGAERFNFTSPFLNIKALPVPKTEVDPFPLEEVEQIISTVRIDFRNYYIVRFFTGLRTSEIDGLKWRYVDFNRREILVRETLVKGRKETTKTLNSSRAVSISNRVFEALKSQYEETGKRSEYVFCTKTGGPLSYANVTNRVWYPTLDHLGLRRRRAYQTRHTTATLWLAAGENPEWIARQMGHSTTKMLFSVYSRFVPNITRQDGSAFERLIGKA